MDKKAATAEIIIAGLLIFSVGTLPTVLADTWLTSGNIQLEQEAYLQYFVQLQAGDRFEGNFTVTGLTPHYPTSNLPLVNKSQIQTFGVEIFAFAEIGEGGKNPQIFHFANDYLNPSGESQYFFNYTAEYSAFYYVDFYCSTNIFGNVEIPKVTVNFDIIKATSQTPTLSQTPLTTPSPAPTISPSPTPTVPEFPSRIILPAIAVATLSSLALFIKRRG